MLGSSLHCRSYVSGLLKFVRFSARRIHCPLISRRWIALARCRRQAHTSLGAAACLDGMPSGAERLACFHPCHHCLSMHTMFRLSTSSMHALCCDHLHSVNNYDGARNRVEVSGLQHNGRTWMRLGLTALTRILSASNGKLIQ